MSAELALKKRNRHMKENMNNRDDYMVFYKVVSVLFNGYKVVLKFTKQPVIGGAYLNQLFVVMSVEEA